MAAGLFKNAALVVQCRLSSSRLPQKALKNLGGRECLCWTLDAMKKVPAARYFLACDFDSKSALEPIAKKCGWEIFAGSRDDVLGRFCSLIESELSDCDLIVRATGDNPFLFWEAAELSIKEFQEKYFEADYFTFSGLPHGSGVELFKAASLLKARSMTDSAYDHEHVGPALYKHQETFKCVFAPAPKEFNFPELRTTIDTFADYKRALRLVDFFKEKNLEPPYSAKDILAALEDKRLQKAVLIIPRVRAGNGTGHLRRALSLAKALKAFVFITESPSLKECGSLLEKAKEEGLKDFQIVAELGGGWDLVVQDLFRGEKEEMKAHSSLGPLCSIDDGGKFFEAPDCLLDVIPSLPRKGPGFLSANMERPAFISLPKNRAASFPKEIKSALVSVSGEGLSEFSERAFSALKSLGVRTELVSAKNPVPNLKERFAEFDLIVTHYGFTAFEALAANRAVLQDITRETIQERYPDIPVITPMRAAEHLAAIAAENDFTLYEFFQTDVSGHSLDYARACAVLRTYDRFLGTLLQLAEVAGLTIVMTADHGNIESILERGHTTNPVPFIAVGPREERIRSRVRSLIDVAGAVLDAFE